MVNSYYTVLTMINSCYTVLTMINSYYTVLSMVNSCYNVVLTMISSYITQCRQERIMRAAVRKVGAGIAHAFN